MRRNAYRDLDDLSRAESGVSLRLAEIQQRVSELLTDPDALELTLEEPLAQPDGTNPYDRG
jgi:hypothetical protein